MRVCVVIPMYNEERVAASSIETTMKYIGALPGGVDLLVVNDGSGDGTQRILDQYAQQDRSGCLKFVAHETNRGYGAALRTGIEYAAQNDYDYVLFMDSDLTNHPRYLQAFYEKMMEGWDYIKATRYAKAGGEIQGVPWKRRIIAIVGNGLARAVYRLPLTDLTNGFRAAKVSLLSRITLTETGFAIIMEELFQVQSLTKSFCDVPYVLTTRANHAGETHFSYDMGTYRGYLRWVLKKVTRLMP